MRSYEVIILNLMKKLKKKLTYEIVKLEIKKTCEKFGNELYG